MKQAGTCGANHEFGSYDLMVADTAFLAM